MTGLEDQSARYVVRYYDHVMTTQQRRASTHLAATTKATHGRSDEAVQKELLKDSSHRLRSLFSNDPDVLQLAKGGIDAFVMRTAQTILDEHADEIIFNCCPKCGAVAKTPKARQCRFCRYDWHSSE
jgi:hypothetical protein